MEHLTRFTCCWTSEIRAIRFRLTAFRFSVPSSDPCLVAGSVLGYPLMGASLALKKVHASSGCPPGVISASASRCTKAALEEAECQLMEPVMSVEVSVGCRKTRSCRCSQVDLFNAALVSQRFSVFLHLSLLQMCEGFTLGLGNLRPARSVDMACIRIFVTHLEYKIRSKRISMASGYLACPENPLSRMVRQRLNFSIKSIVFATRQR